ncbi:hypothetical protein GCM10010082_06990 [Kushneria pakistanensis]|uniref:Uncharacterized protein n=1 Tax=Kushneria pakistanensis TaxID=1508770 RepID=A0ABQ3FCA0_9GAMM|nr:hypothetical protein GCM10010082_06990 [Kushneria pakistanensis]
MRCWSLLSQVVAMGAWEVLTLRQPLNVAARQTTPQILNDISTLPLTAQALLACAMVDQEGLIGTSGHGLRPAIPLIDILVYGDP